jgi:copper chaperone NosL
MPRYAVARFVPVVFLCMTLAVPSVFAAGREPQKPKATDKCPVCGMFVAKYPNFAAQLKFRDGSLLHFDGNRDLFTCYLDLARCAPGKKAADVAGVFVTGYYDLRRIDGKAAYYVVGSDVMGVMGPELIPFPKESEAREFLNDHRGRAILRFNDVTRQTLGTLAR